MLEMTTAEDITVLKLTGDLSHFEMSQLERTLHRLMEAQRCQVVLNLTNVEHINYKTLKRLLKDVEQFRRRRGDLKIASMNHYTQEILRFTGIDRRVESYNSVSEAILSFEKRASKHRTLH